MNYFENRNYKDFVDVVQSLNNINIFILKILLKIQVEMLLLVQFILNSLSIKYQRKAFIANR